MKSSIEELQVFIAVVDTGSLGAAADLLKQTVSGVSRALSRLEQKLGVTLLERTTRRLKLTQEGLLFLQSARQILNDLSAAEDALLKSDSDIAGLIRVDAATSFVLHVMAPLIQQFRRCYPHIKVELNSNDQIVDLLEKKTDVAIRIGNLHDSSLHAKFLIRSRLYLVASPSYVAEHGCPQSVDDLLQHQLIGFSQHPHLNVWPILKQGQALKICPDLTANTGETIRKLALYGNGIACLSEFMIHQDLKKQDLIPILTEQTVFKEQVIQAVYYQQEHLPKRVRLLIEFLAEQLAQGFPNQ
ncbi:LysR family transcriptional regulator [Serratia sp. S1B]|nr:LysR family transcriptional regulator [Serratia sp. S1B]